MIVGNLDAEQPIPRVVLSYGLGTDSTALLLRWLTEPTSRDFDLDELVVITAMTGDEWPITGTLVQQHILPLLTTHGVRFIQVARRGPTRADGVIVLSDSRRPSTVHLAGAYRLSDEMLTAGTIPQTGGARKCSTKAKGWPLDTVVSAITQGRRYRHMLGFEAGEHTRAKRDTQYNTATRTGEYPLITWGWDRSTCHDFIRHHFGVEWVKSACTYCPFALATKAGRQRTLVRFAEEPTAGVLALEMEYLATALNPAQGLIGGDRLLTLLQKTPGNDSILAQFYASLDSQQWAVYDVRRTLSPRKDGKAKVSRFVEQVTTGTPGRVRHDLAGLASTHATRITIGSPAHPCDDHPRVWLRRRVSPPPTDEHFLTIAPATVADKVGPGFWDAWNRTTQQTLFF